MTHFVTVLEKNAVEFAERIAVKTKSSVLSYQKFNQRINQYANFLNQQATSSDQKTPRIAIIYHRSLDMLLWMLAAWKVNASFMLIDSGDLQKEGLVKDKLDQIQPQFIVTSIKFRDHKEFTNASKIYLDDIEIQNRINLMTGEFTFHCPPDNSEAYIIATSGSSTGVGKLVIINHTLAPDSGLAAVFDDISELMQLGKDDSVLIDGAVNWDPNICLIGVGLYHGSSIYIATPEETHDRHSLLLDCKVKKINVMLVVPSAVFEIEPKRDLLHQIESLRLIFTGEKLTEKIVDDFIHVARGGIYNGYGPSEGPIGITATRVTNRDSISIGRRMKGRDYAIVNSNGEAANEGELIWKAQGFGGYLGNEVETNKKLIRYNDENYYRSGDQVGKEDDKLIFLGRIDKQFKVLGILFNPENVDEFLRKTFAGIECRTLGVVAQYTDTKVPVVFFNKSNAKIEDLKVAIEANQNAPMIQFMRLNDNEHFPQTKNGKVNEKALVARYSEYINRNTPNAITVQEVLGQIWCAILGATEIADENKTFKEQGGDSIRFRELLVALSRHPVIKNILHINEISTKVTTLTFKQLVELTKQVNRANYVKFLHQEKIDYPVIIIDGSLSEDYSEIAPNSPLVIVQPRNPNDTPEDKLLDAYKTIEQAGIEGPYFVVQVLADDVCTFGQWQKLPSQFYFFDKYLKPDLHKVILPAIENAINNDLRHKVINRSGVPTLVLDYASSFKKELVRKGLFPKHLKRIMKSKITIVVRGVSEYADYQDAIRKEIRALGLNVHVELEFRDKDVERIQYLNEQIECLRASLGLHTKVIYPQRTFDPIVTFYNAEQKANPLFLFAPFTGEDVYQNFCKQINSPCIVLKHPLLSEGPNNFPTDFPSIQELAKFFAAVVQHYQPTGYLNLAGWSFGGLMAIAVAQQLDYRINNESNRAIYYVGIIDTSAPDFLFASSLMERVKWILHTYAIEHDEIDIKKMKAASSEYVWELLTELVAKISDPKKREYVGKIIQVCHQHYNFGIQRLPHKPNQHYHLYCAEQKSSFHGGIPFFKFRSPWKKIINSLGWDLPPHLIRGTNHFTILESEELINAIVNDCIWTRASNVNVQETLKELILSQLPKKLKPTVNPELQNIIENKNPQENSLILQENTSEKKLMGLQLLHGIWKNYLSDPAKNPLPIYIDLIEWPNNSFHTFFEKLNLSPTQPHCIEEMNIVLIIDHVDSVGAFFLRKSIQNSPIDLNNHPVICLCEKEHYQQNESLHEQLKLGHSNSNTGLQKK